MPNKTKIKFNINRPKSIPDEIFKLLEEEINKVKKSITKTKPGSVKYLFFGEEISKQSFCIKLGKILGENFPKNLINLSENFEMEECGILQLQDCKKKKDFDLIFKDNKHNIIYYVESKGNMELDTEKLPATIDKVKKLGSSLKKKYPEYKIISAIYNWSIYDREDAVGGLTQINTCEKEDVKVYHFKDFINILNYKMSKEEFWKFFRELGKI